MIWIFAAKYQLRVQGAPREFYSQHYTKTYQPYSMSKLSWRGKNR